MKKLKTIWRVLKLLLLIILASMGIGLTGGIPLQLTPNKERMESAIELVMSEKKENDQKVYVMSYKNTFKNTPLNKKK